MLITLTFLTLLTRIPYGLTTIRSCIPNTQFLLNGRLCNCNSLGQSDDASCHMIGRRQSCQPGQIIWEECSQCICQENGKLLCTNTECTEEVKPRAALRIGSTVWCTPFRSYYVNCTLCICPASGKMAEARCASDSSCSLKGPHTSPDTFPQNRCIPKVMYLFTCLHCLCSDEGLFIKSKCIETCHKPAGSPKRCIPKSFFKADCNICFCPENGTPDTSLCSKTTCKQNTKLTSLISLRNVTSKCVPNKYTKPRCIYCECNAQGTVNEQACLEKACLRVDDYNYESVKSICIPGEMVPTCVECFCPRSKLTIEKYCTRVCSPQSKLAILETVLKEKVSLVDRSIVKETIGTDSCDPDSLFLDQGRYCLCSEKGSTNIKLCTSVLEDVRPKKPSKVVVDNGMQSPRKIDFNISCEPNTYIEFGCNSCYCTKEGKLDPKWCTSDDCNVKNVINENNNKDSSLKELKGPGTITTCIPGSITKEGCNFCICGSSGLIRDKVCTKISCAALHPIPSTDLSCDPSSYYSVDCNMCYCPSDGIKNVEKCTKNHCETNFLRSNACTPGELFSSDCNICVCPPSRDKKDKVCTNRTCTENDAPWKKIFRISQNLLGNRVAEDTTKNFEPCFPGEEFEEGCKVCVCPDMGLKEYATCTAMLCDTQSTAETDSLNEDRQLAKTKDSDAVDGRKRVRHHIYHKEHKDDHHDDDDDDGGHGYGDEFCSVYNLTDSNERRECTPGSEYIIRCQVCICPYMGAIGAFCRPMPKDRYCEEAYPGFNFLPMGRRNEENSTLYLNTTAAPPKIEYPITIHMPHNHTKYKCDVEGRITEECFICDCKNKVIIEEHCYKSDATNCTDVTVPACIKKENRLDT